MAIYLRVFCVQKREQFQQKDNLIFLFGKSLWLSLLPVRSPVNRQNNRQKQLKTLPYRNSLWEVIVQSQLKF